MDRSQFEKIKIAVQNLGSEVSVSDFDGTVKVWQGLMEVNSEIGRCYPQKRSLVQPLEDMIQAYRDRTFDFETLVHETIKVQGQIFRGLPRDEVRSLSAALARRHLSKVYVFPSRLIKAHQELENRRAIIAITGSPAEYAEPFCAALGMDAVASATYSVDAAGYYTGERDETCAIRKHEVMDELERELGVSWWIGMGDSPSDWPLLTRAKVRLAINPNGALLQKLRTNPELEIFRVEDHQKGGIQIYKFDHHGRQHETNIFEALPFDFASRMSKLPGLWRVQDQPSSAP